MARFHVHEVLVENAQTAGTTARTVRVDDVDHVVGTTDVSEVLSDALAQIHASVACALYQHQLVRRLAFGAKIFGLAYDVFGGVYTQIGYTYIFCQNSPGKILLAVHLVAYDAKKN